MKKVIVFASFLVIISSCQNTLTSEQILENAIAYHDPESEWPSFNGTLNVTMETPKQTNRESEIIINLPEDYFYVKAVRDTLKTEYTLDKGKCTIALNGKTELSKSELFSNGLTCDRAKMYSNYYTYLYGLPMKLKDPGTNIESEYEIKTFKGKEYLVIKATYDETVGSDIWYFYFDPETYAMEIYQFFKTDESGNMIDDSGEYILLTDETIVSNIKMPKVRAWYYNKDDGYLGTDTLN